MFREHAGGLFEITIVELSEKAMRVRYANGDEMWKEREHYLMNRSSYWKESTFVEELSPRIKP